MIDRKAEHESAEMKAARRRVDALEVRVGAVATGVKTLRREVNGDIKR